MNGVAAASDPLRPQSPGGMGRGATLAVLVHALLVVALAFGVRWRASEPEGLTAELWSVVPQVAAPPPPQPAPAPPPPAPEPPRAAEAPRPDAEIALEKARREREAKERAEQERIERERTERERAERERIERERAEKQRIEREKAEKERAERLRLEEERRRAELAEKFRQEQLQRMTGQAGGPPSSTGTAAQSAGPSATYAGRVRAAVYPNITLLASVPDDIEAEVEVRSAPDGTILGRRLVKSSGHSAWDDAVLRAIDRTGRLPRDVDGRVPSPMVLAFTPRQ